MRQKLRSEEGKGLRQARVHGEPVFGEIKWDGRKLSMDLPWLGESARGVFATVPRA